MIDIRIPKPFKASSLFFGLFSTRELARLLTPLIAGTGYLYPFTGNLVELAVLATATFTGLTWAKWTPYGYKIDQLIYHGIRFNLRKNATSGQTIEEQNEDHVVLSDGTVLGVIEINSVNLEAQTKDEQAAAHRTYQDLIESVNHPLTITSRQKPLDLTNHLQHVKENSTTPGYLEQDYIDHCQDLTDSETTSTSHYLLVHVPPANRDGDVLKDELDARCQDILEKLNTGDLSANRLTQGELTQAVTDIDTIQPCPTSKYIETGEDASSRYRRTVYIEEYPSTLSLGWPVKLLQADAQVEVTQVIEPVNSSKAVKKLHRLQEKLTAEIDSLLRHGHQGTQKLESTLEDTQWFLNQLTDRRCQAVQHGVYITVTGETEEDCNQGFEKICNRLDTGQVKYREPFLQTDQAFHTVSLRNGDHLDEKQLMPTSSAAAALSFATKGSSSETGVLYGTDTDDQSPVILNRFNWNAPHTVRIGATGSGKSYAEKQELLRTRLTASGINIYVVDPKNEYSHLIEALDGDTAQAGESLEEHSAVAVQVPERGQQGNTDLLIKTVQELYRVTSQSSGRSLVVIDEAHNLMRRSEGRQVLSQFIREARDTDTAITLISQNAADFTEHHEGRAILDNTPAKIFTQHERVPDSVVDYFQLSQREKQDLRRVKTGTDSDYSQAVLKVSNRIDTQIRVESTPSEHAIIETGEQPEPREEGQIEEEQEEQVDQSLLPVAAAGGTGEAEAVEENWFEKPLQVRDLKYGSICFGFLAAAVYLSPFNPASYPLHILSLAAVVLLLSSISAGVGTSYLHHRLEGGEASV